MAVERIGCERLFAPLFPGVCGMEQQVPFGNDRKKGEGETQGGTQIPSGMTKKELMLTDLEGFQI